MNAIVLSIFDAFKLELICEGLVKMRTISLKKLPVTVFITIYRLLRDYNYWLLPARTEMHLGVSGPYR